MKTIDSIAEMRRGFLSSAEYWGILAVIFTTLFCLINKK